MTLVLDILKSNISTPEAIYEILLITQGDEQVLLKHLKAITSIMNKGIKELEKVESDKDVG